MRQVNDFEKWVNKASDILYFCLLQLFIFLVRLKDVVQYCTPFWNRIDISKIFHQHKQTSNSICIFQNIYKELVKWLQICNLFFSFFSFLCKDVKSPDSRLAGKMQDFIDLFIFFHQNSAKISKFFFTILVGISEPWDVLFIFKVRISFSILLKSISSKASFIRFLQLLWIARMLGWSCYFIIALKFGSLTSFITGSKFKYWLISRFFSLFPKKVFKVLLLWICF